MLSRRIGLGLAVAFVMSVLVMIGSAPPASALTSKVDITLTSSNGCKYHIKGTVHYGPWTTPGFVGTVTVSGDKPECNGIIPFDEGDLGSRTTGRLTVALNTTDLRNLSRITWSGSPLAAADFLNTDESNRAICEAVRAAVGG
jgi:hypothetical protein